MRLDLVTFELAKTLKELGFPRITFCPYYKENGELENGLTDLGQGIYTAPSLELAAKWLRDKCNIFIFPTLANPGLSEYRYDKIFTFDYSEGGTIRIPSKQRFHTYEEALSAGIDRAIGMLLHNLITENLKSVDLFPKNTLPSSDIFDN